MVKPTVYITQDAVGRNFLPARRYGDLHIIMPANAQILITSTPALRRLKYDLRNFCDDDYLLLSGDPLIMGLAVAIAAEINQGRAQVLKWDRGEKDYYAVGFNLREKTDE